MKEGKKSWLGEDLVMIVFVIGAFAMFTILVGLFLLNDRKEIENDAIRLEIQKLELQKEILEIEGIHKELG